MAVEGGKNWHKEVGAIDAAAETKRIEFYSERVKTKLGDTFDNIVADVAGKGYKTLDELKDKNYEQEIKSGNTLFVTLRQYFNEVLGGGAQAGADNEAYLSLAILMKDYPGVGVNVDNLQVGGKIEIKDGYLTVKDAAGKVTIDNKPLRRPGGPKVEEPSTLLPPVSVPGPVELPPATSKTEEPAAAPSTEPTVPTEAPTDKVVPLPSSTPDTGKEDTAPDSSATKPDSPEHTEVKPEKVIYKIETSLNETTPLIVLANNHGLGLRELKVDDKVIWQLYLPENDVATKNLNLVKDLDGSFKIDGLKAHIQVSEALNLAEILLKFQKTTEGMPIESDFQKNGPYYNEGRSVKYAEEKFFGSDPSLEAFSENDAQSIVAFLNQRYKSSLPTASETPAAAPAATEQPATTPAAPAGTPPAAPAAPSSAQSAPVAGPETPTE